MTQPLVSIVMPAYNRADLIDTALASCLQQTYPNVEIIVVDDGSTDATVARVQAYGQRVRLIQQANQGPSIARNRGIEVARGDYIQFCDSDDRLHPEKIARCLPVMLADPALAVVFSKCQRVNSAGDVIADKPTYPADAYFDETNDIFCLMLKYVGNPLQTSTLLVRKAAMEAVGMFRADPQRCAEDWDLLLRLADQYSFRGVPDVLVDYRYHDDALTQIPLEMAEGRLQTTIYAGEYGKRRVCLSDAAYDAMLAGRHHQLAVTLWYSGQPAAARRHFTQAMRLTAQGRRMRYLTRLATYLMPARTFDWFHRTFIRRLR